MSFSARKSQRDLKRQKTLVGGFWEEGKSVYRQFRRKARRGGAPFGRRGEKRLGPQGGGGQCDEKCGGEVTFRLKNRRLKREYGWG